MNDFYSFLIEFSQGTTPRKEHLERRYSAEKVQEAQIYELSSRLPTINESIKAEEKEQIKLCNDKLREIEQQANPIKEKIAAAEKRIGEIQTELTKNR